MQVKPMQGFIQRFLGVGYFLFFFFGGGGGGGVHETLHAHMGKTD